MNHVLKTENLGKNYGHIDAVNGLNLEIERGTVFGILGSNGSGKTTLLSMLVDIIRPTSGHIWWFGQPLNHRLTQKVGAIIEHPIFYPYMSGQKNLELSALIKQVEERHIVPALENVGLADYKNNKYETYSLGMKQRLAIASALLHNPDVLILDEPTNGLDPMGIADIRGIIQKIAATGKTILLASHLLDEVEKVCSHVAILNKGKMIYNGAMKDLQGEHEIIELSVEKEGIVDILYSFEGTSTVTQKDQDYLVTLKKGIKSHDLNKFLLEKNIIASRLAMREHTLEKQFLDILKNSK